MKKKFLNSKIIFTISLFGFFLFFAMASCNSNKSENTSKSNSRDETPSWTCRNCGNHTYHLKDEWLKICDKCGAGD